MVPTNDSGRFYAFRRIFSGKMKQSEKVRILGPNYVKGKQVGIHIITYQRVVLTMGRKAEDDVDARIW